MRSFKERIDPDPYLIFTLLCQCYLLPRGKRNFGHAR